MTIIWVDWVNGLDTNAGTDPLLPKKTITSATTSRTGGDEIRVAKSPDPTPLTGSVEFTKSGTGITGTGTLFATELTIGDYILGGDGYWYEIIAIASNTSATLYQKYASNTQSGVSSQKLGFTSTGEAASGAQVQVVSSNGTSSTSRLVISGGWDLSTLTQTGTTNFRQLHSTFANRYGYGLYASKSYLSIIKLGFFRYNVGIYLAGTYSNLSDIKVGGTSSYGISISASNKCVLTNIQAYSAASSAIYLSASNVINITNSQFISCGGASGSSIGTSSSFYKSEIKNVICAGGYSFYSSAVSSRGNIFTDIYLYNMSSMVPLGGFSDASDNIFLGNLSHDKSATYAASVYTGTMYVKKNNMLGSTFASNTFTDYTNPIISIDNNQNTTYSIIYTDSGNIVSQAASAGGTGKEWKLSPTSSKRDSYYPLTLPVVSIAVSANTQVTVTCFFKKSGNGVAGALRCRYGQVGWLEGTEDIIVNCPDNTSRNQVTLQFTPTESGVVQIEALTWYVSSTTQTVIIDDIAVTQA